MCLIHLVSNILSLNHFSLAESRMLFTLFTVSDSTVLDLELLDLLDLVTTLFGFVLVTVSEITFLLLDTLFDFTLTVSVSLGELVDLAGLLDLVGLALLTFSGSDGELADLVGLLALVGLADFEALSISAVKFSSNSSGIGRIGLCSVLPLGRVYDLIVAGF